MIQEDRFPKQYRLGARAVGWRANEIDDWMSSRQLS